MSGLLAGKACVVSGVGPGMGQAIARALAREGAAVALAARSAPFLEEVAASIRDAGGTAVAIPTDVTDAGQCRVLVDTAARQLGSVDVLVNAAFRPDVFKRFDEVDLDEWRAIFEVNVFGSLQLAQAAVPLMVEQKRGSIVFVGSMTVRKPPPRQGGYAASKGALLVAARALAVELGRFGIRVNTVVPGWMWGPPVQGYVEYLASRRDVAPDEVYGEIASRIPLGRIPTQEECAEAVVFLASDLSSAMTGQTLDVNGGEVLH